METDAEAEDIFSRINGVFMTGGEDWNPSLYDEEAYPHGSSGWNDDRDTSDLHLMQNAIELDVPMLAVCRGEQGFNVAMGGGLIQDVPTYLGEQVKAGKIAEDRATVIEDTGIGWGDNRSRVIRLITASRWTAWSTAAAMAITSWILKTRDRHCSGF